MTCRLVLPVIALALTAAPTVHATDPALFLTGKPQLGQVLRFEIEAPGSSTALLLVDTLPGPATVQGVTFGIGFSPALLMLALPVPPTGELLLAASIPDDPALEGLALWTEVAVTGPLVVSGAVPITLAEPLALDAVDDFTYRLQGHNGADLTLTEISGSAFDLCVVDFSADGSSEFSPAQIAGLQGPAEPDRIRLAYMSIGEAEDYRWYWNSISQDLIASSNPQWPGNFKATFWEPEWKQVIIHGNAAVGTSYLDRIIDQGFDGVYLDIFDAFEFFGPAEAGGGGSDWKRDAAREMIDFVTEIAFHARFVRGRPDFLVVPQNGSNILDEEWYPLDTLGPGDPATPAGMAAEMEALLLQTVDGIGTEDVFYGGNNDQNNAYNPDNYLLGFLATWKSYGLTVLSTEYLTQSGKINAFYDTHAPAQGFIPYATVRDLDEMTVNPGHDPD